MIKLLRIMRLDESDRQVYDPVARPGEWAIPGSFYFWDSDPTTLTGKTRQAFVHGFLGLDSFGWGTLAVIDEISPAELAKVTQQLAAHLVERFGAPSLEAALPAAQEEIDFARSLCEPPVNTVIALQRDDENGDITESFTVVRPAGLDHGQVRLFGAEES